MVHKSEFKVSIDASINFGNEYFYRQLAIKIIESIQFNELEKLFEFSMIDPRNYNGFSKNMINFIDIDSDSPSAMLNNLRHSNAILYKAKMKTSGWSDKTQ